MNDLVTIASAFVLFSVGILVLAAAGLLVCVVYRHITDN